MLAVLAAAVCVCAAKPLRIGYFYGQKEYDGEGALRWLAGRMEADHGAKSVFFAGQDVDTDTSDATALVIPNLGELDSLDVLVLDVRRFWLNKAQLAKMQAFLNSGKGIVGIRAAAYAFSSWNAGFGIDSVILGGAYNGHTNDFGYDLELTAAGKASPILAGVSPWKAGDKLYLQDYKGRTLQPDCDILMYGIQGAVRSPVAWTRVRMGSNIFNTTTGVQSDLKDPQFQKLIVNAVLWAGKSLGTTGMVRAQTPQAMSPVFAHRLAQAHYRADGRYLPAATAPAGVEALRNLPSTAK